ncbi:HlyD family efflux transporter periplasmic adaptor subunit [Candidatus Gracilibacteria bacterium]|nr:HlyD family efflux transporter periplasmic adaptor subunit [Candidatus Gracilibacteria bacterium]
MNHRGIAFIVLFALSLFFLTSCSGDEDTEEYTSEKQDFFIETRLGSDLKNESIIEKVGQVRSTQDIQVSSQASGRVVSLNVQKGQRVTQGQVIAELQDISGNIIFGSERADVGLERAMIQRDSTLLTLEKQLFDIGVQIESTERSLITLRSDREQNIRLLEDNVSSANISDIDSRSFLQLEQFDANLERQRLEYETRLISDNQTRESFIDFFGSNENTLRVLLDNVIDFADPIFSVTEKNRFSNARFTTFLGARNSAQRSATETLLKELIELRESGYFSDFRSDFVGRDLSDEEILLGFEVLTDGYEILRRFIPELNETLNNTIESAGQLSQTELQGWKTQTQGFQSSFSANYSAYINTQNQASAFLRTYENAQESQKRSIELQEKEREILVRTLSSGSLSAEVGRDRAILSIDDQITSLETQLSQLKNTKETTERNYEITQKSLNNAINEATIGQRQSSLELSKLIVRAPITGVIEDVLIDLGQEIQMGTPVISLLAESTPELQISVSEYERNLLTLGQEVFVDIGKERYRGSITAISEVADRRFNYSISVIFSGAQSSLGSIARVSMPVMNDDFLLPLRLIEAIGESQGRVSVYKNGNILNVRLRLGRVFGDSIEVLSCAEECDTLEIIWNDISNYNSNDFTLKRR